MNQDPADEPAVNDVDQVDDIDVLEDDGEDDGDADGDPEEFTTLVTDLAETLTITSDKLREMTKGRGYYNGKKGYPNGKKGEGGMGQFPDTGAAKRTPAKKFTFLRTLQRVQVQAN